MEKFLLHAPEINETMIYRKLWNGLSYFESHRVEQRMRNEPLGLFLNQVPLNQFGKSKFVDRWSSFELPRPSKKKQVDHRMPRHNAILALIA